jgi:proteic killer suppression protein
VFIKILSTFATKFRKRMKIYFKNKKLEKLCNNLAKLVKAMGSERAEKIQLRLNDLDSALTLEDTRHLPGHYHELVGDRKGQWGCDLDQPYRLVFEPTEKPIPTDENGKYIWSAITIIDIIEITNYHGK